MEDNFRCGFVSLIGRPNVGKSTLLNRLLGEKIAIVTDKPQTTRNRIVGIRNYDDGQLILLDTPGMHQPRGRLNEALVEISSAAWRDADLALLLFEAATGKLRRGERELLSRAVAENRSFRLAFNKIDCLAEADIASLRRLPMVDEVVADFGLDRQAVFFLSARDGFGVEELGRELLAAMPLHPPYFPSDMQTEISERFWAAEVIREQVFKQTHDEIPYAVAVEVDYFRDLEKRLSIGATIYVEQNSQKGIIIGRGGRQLKSIGTAARRAIENFVGIPVYLELHVAVARKWSSNPAQLKRFGYRE